MKSIDTVEYRAKLMNIINDLTFVRLAGISKQNQVGELTPNLTLVNSCNVAIDAIKRELLDTYKINGNEVHANGHLHVVDHDISMTVDVVKDQVKIGEKTTFYPLEHPTQVNINICARCKFAAESDIRSKECICMNGGKLKICETTSSCPLFEVKE